MYQDGSKVITSPMGKCVPSLQLFDTTPHYQFVSKTFSTRKDLAVWNHNSCIDFYPPESNFGGASIVFVLQNFQKELMDLHGKRSIGLVLEAANDDVCFNSAGERTWKQPKPKPRVASPCPARGVIWCCLLHRETTNRTRKQEIIWISANQHEIIWKIKVTSSKPVISTSEVGSQISKSQRETGTGQDLYNWKKHWLFDLPLKKEGGKCGLSEALAMRRRLVVCSVKEHCIWRNRHSGSKTI